MMLCDKLRVPELLWTKEKVDRVKENFIKKFSNKNISMENRKQAKGWGKKTLRHHMLIYL